MTDGEVNDPQAERREVKNTYLSHTHADEAGGRFMRLVPTTGTGAGPVPEYPAASPHHADPTGLEPPLGIDVNETVPAMREGGLPISSPKDRWSSKASPTEVARQREIASQVLDFLTKSLAEPRTVLAAWKALYRAHSFLRTTTASVHPALQPALERTEAVVAAIGLWAAQCSANAKGGLVVNPLAFAEDGIAIFPVRLLRVGERWRKIPHIDRWQHRASADPRQVEEWWRQWPDALPGIALARCKLVVVDCDRHGGPDGVAAFAELGPMPPHPIVTTLSNGEHHFFRQPDPPIASNSGFNRLGIDVLGTSRFVVGYDPAPLLAVEAPPLPEVFRAKTTMAGHRLETPRCCVGPAPGVRAVVSRNSREGRYARAALHNAFEKFSSWPWVRDAQGCRWQPGRNNMLNKLAYKMGGLVANGWIDEALVIRVLMLGAAECGLLLEDGEEQCLATIRSGLSKGMQLPYPQLEPRYL